MKIVIFILNIITLCIIILTIIFTYKNMKIIKKLDLKDNGMLFLGICAIIIGILLQCGSFLNANYEIMLICAIATLSSSTSFLRWRKNIKSLIKTKK